MNNAILVSGGAGFIGSNFVLEWIQSGKGRVINLDALTYASNLRNLDSLKENPDHVFVHGNICDRELVEKTLAEHKPRAIVHFAAESHVDRSILGPDAFLKTNIEGTFTLLQAARAYVADLPEEDQAEFRFLHVSTDEVYGTLEPEDPPFSETTAYAPNSPYAASKAASDFLGRAWFHTYKLPVLITNCSNNYGPFQFPEKLVPLVITHALTGKPLPVYGDGMQVRDWLFVTDHCKAIAEVLAKGSVGETYNIGGNNQRSNLEVVKTICGLLDELAPGSPYTPHAQLITYVKDRPGHDRRYAIDARKIERELQWKPEESFETGMRKTVEWYLANKDWIASATDGAYQEWVNSNYGDRARTAEAK
ncbi:MAG: dTDP-glucose 4,6-dehydratase [Acidobacteriaceae bacterium]